MFIHIDNVNRDDETFELISVSSTSKWIKCPKNWLKTIESLKKHIERGYLDNDND